MATCTQCKKKIGCACKKRVAEDGTSCCTLCVTKYNVVHPKEIKSQISATAPTNVTASYNGPGIQI